MSPIFRSHAKAGTKLKALAPMLLLLPFLAACSFAPLWELPYANPPESFRDSDIVGTWEVSYFNGGTDSLTIRPDHTFRQTYRRDFSAWYVYQTSWSNWWTERFSDGRVRLYLQGARYYRLGIQMAEHDGYADPLPEHIPGMPDSAIPRGPRPEALYDPIGGQLVQIAGKLVLNIRSDSNHSLLLMHMWDHVDSGYPLFGYDLDFHRIDAH